MRAARAAALAACVVFAAICSPTHAELLAGSDGWHSWQTDEAGAITDMCCFTRQRGAGSRAVCYLDETRLVFSSGDDCAASPGRAQYYVLVEDGKPREIRVLSEACPVETGGQITDHGIVPAAENLAWFRRVIEDRTVSNDVREEALFALVLSESNLAFDYLDRILSANVPAGR